MQKRSVIGLKPSKLNLNKDLSSNSLESKRESYSLSSEHGQVFNLSSILPNREVFFKLLAESVPMGIGLAPPSRGFKYVNDAFASILGYSLPELIAMDWENLTYEEDHNKNFEEFQQLLNDEITSFEFEKRYIHKNGQVIWCRLKVAKIWEEGMEEVLVLAIIDDITEDKKLKEELENQQLLLSLGEKTAGICSLIYNYETRTAIFSKNLSTLFGYEEGEVKEDNFYEKLIKRIHPDSKELHSKYQKPNPERKKVSYDMKILLPGDRTRWIRVSRNVYLDDHIWGAFIQDITQEKEQIERLEQLSDMIKIGEKVGSLAFATRNLETGELIYSDNLMSLLQVSPDLAMRLDSKTIIQVLMDKIHPDDQYIIKELFNNAKQNPNLDIQVEVRIIASEEEFRWIRMNSHPYKLNKFRIGVFQDITEEKLRIQQLESQAEMIRIGEKAGGMAFITRNLKTGKFIYTDNLLQLLEVSKEELMNEGVTQMVMKKAHPDDLANIQKSLGKANQSPSEDFQVEFRLLKEVEKVKWIRVNARSFKLNESRIAVMQDITEEKLRIQQLESQAEMIRIGERVGGMGMNIWNSKTNEVIYSDNLLKMYEIAPEGVNGNNALDKFGARFHPEDMPKLNEFIKQSEKNLDEKLEIVHRIILPNQQIKWIRVISERYIYPDTRISILTDITPSMIQSEKLTNINNELEQLLYSVSHDLRAPIRHVNSYAQMLSRSVGSKLEEKEETFLKSILKASTRLGVMIDELLQYFRSNNQKLDKEWINIKERIESTRQLFEQDTMERNIKWEISEIPDVFADRLMMDKVLLNLLSNAVKFTEKAQDPTIRISGQKLKDEVLITVEDNGAGFKMKYYDKLFAVFQRLHSQRDFEGTGIGLANVNRIITIHGGQIWAESEPNKGAKFQFTIKNPSI